MVFAGYSGFLHYLHLASHELATTAISVTINEIPNQNQNQKDAIKIIENHQQPCHVGIHWKALAEYV